MVYYQNPKARDELRAVLLTQAADKNKNKEGPTNRTKVSSNSLSKMESRLV